MGKLLFEENIRIAELECSGNSNNSNGGYEETGVGVCEVQYLDMGKFTVNASIYKEKLKN